MAELAVQRSSVRGAVRNPGAILPGCECVVVGEVNGGFKSEVQRRYDASVAAS